MSEPVTIGQAVPITRVKITVQTTVGDKTTTVVFHELRPTEPEAITIKVQEDDPPAIGTLMRPARQLDQYLDLHVNRVPLLPVGDPIETHRVTVVSGAGESLRA